MVTLLGIGKSRLAKAEASQPDLRFGHQERGSSLEAESCQAFFHRTYTKLGESLPDKFVRRKKSKKKKATESDSSSVGSEFDISDDEDHTALLKWLDRSDDSSVHNISLNQDSLPKRWLPPGNISELYDHYSVVQMLLHGRVASCLREKMMLSIMFVHPHVNHPARFT